MNLGCIADVLADDFKSSNNVTEFMRGYIAGQRLRVATGAIVLTRTCFHQVTNHE